MNDDKEIDAFPLPTESMLVLTKAVHKALETLSELMGQDALQSDKVRLDAAKAVLEYAAYGVFRNHRTE